MSGTALIGIDLGGTNCRAALLAESGEILHSNRIPTRVAEGREQFLSRLFELCDALLSFAEKEKRRVLAVGMGAAGVIAEGGVVT
ncbi:MAG: ROK family protein, partial [Deltaproteobacteria bacterium]|nr:ROK family protein [Deltaproteobacteria bacterium]